MGVEVEGWAAWVGSEEVGGGRGERTQASGLERQSTWAELRRWVSGL